MKGGDEGLRAGWTQRVEMNGGDKGWRAGWR